MYDAFVHAACIYDIHAYMMHISVPRSLTMTHVCMMHISMILDLILKHACMFGACIYDAANFVSNGRTNKAILGV